MPATQTTTTQKTKKEVEFDESGEVTDETAAEEVEETTEEPSEEEGEVAASADDDAEPAAEQGKYRIGDKYFKTIEEAHAYATTEEASGGNALDAYRQGIQDAARVMHPQQNVTQPNATPEPEQIDDEFYANPKEFLNKFAAKIKNETVQSLGQQQEMRDQSDRVWREFTDLHPDLADFRSEVDQFALSNKDTLIGITASKGRKAGLDFIAVKMRAQFARYAEAAKPKKALPNGGSSTTPTTRGTNVTQKKTVNKPLSFSEQIRSIKKTR